MIGANEVEQFCQSELLANEVIESDHFFDKRVDVADPFYDGISLENCLVEQISKFIPFYVGIYSENEKPNSLSEY